MKTPSEELHQLIRSMSQNEKRYVMLQAKGSGQAYLGLFRLINAQPVYQEEAIRKKLNAKDAGQFKKLKHYTFQTLLRGLENFFAASTDEIVVQRKLIQTEVLFDKKLFAHAKKVVHTAYDLAAKKDMLFYKVICLEWIYRLGVASGRPQQTLKELSLEQVRSAMRDCSRWMELRHMNTLFWNFIHTSLEVPTKAETALLKDIIEKATRLYKEAPCGYTLSREAFLLLGLACRFYGEKDQSYVYRKKLVELIESDRAYLYDRSHEYISALGNLINILRELGRDDEVESVFDKARKFMTDLPKRYADFRLDETFCNLQNNFVTFLYTCKKYDEVIAEGEELLKRIRKHSDGFQNSLQSILYQSLMCSYFYKGNFKAAMRFHHMNVKKQDKSDPRWRLFGLVVLFEMGDFDALHYQCRSLQYYFQKLKIKAEAELLLLKAFNTRLIKKYSQREMRSDFASLYDEMKKIKPRFEALRKEYRFDYLDWVNSKL